MSLQNILYPLTYHQESLLYEYLNDPENTRDNLAWKYLFASQTNTERLINAIRQIIVAHPLLNAELVQDGKTYFWKRIDNAVLTSRLENIAEYLNVTNEELQEEEKTFNRPFHLTSGEPLYAFKIFRTPTAVVLFFRIHHSIFDGVSQQIFINELAAAYNNEINNNHTLNDEGALTAGQREQEQLLSAKIDINCNEFIKRIKKCGDITKLHEQKQLDKPAGCAEFCNGNFFPTEQIHNFCDKYSLSPNSIFISAFAAVTSQHSTNSDILFQFIRSGRDEYNSSMIGAFIKKIPIVVRYDNNLSPLENCRKAKEDVKLAVQYGNVILYKQFEQKNDWGQLPVLGSTMLYIFHGNLWDNSKLPLVEGQRIVYSFLNNSSEDKSIPFMPLEFIVGELEGKYSYLCKYNNALFDKKFIEQFILEIDNHIKELIGEVQM
ncbi:MAG: condensation domain-containing protein [Planctomycetaceae bacterium]|jgi:polyketide synthase PksM/polyketide synthase PksN|nr:condensation domain-containing protein [Planctomycetaceae bacterium]